MLTPLLTFVAYTRARLVTGRTAEDGMSTAEYLIMTAALAVGVLAIGAIVIGTLTNKASSISLD